MKKNTKVTLFSGLLLSLIVSVGCIPVAFQGLPALLNQSASPNNRADLCNLLLSVGGTNADVQACLTSTSISQADIDRLCALSANLSDTQKQTVITGLTNLGVNTQDVCPIAKQASPAPTASPTAGETSVPVSPTGQATENPASEPTPAPTGIPTAVPTATNQPIPSPTTGTGGGGSGSGGSGCGSSTCGNDSSILTGQVGGEPKPTPTANNS